MRVTLEIELRLATDGGLGLALDLVATVVATVSIVVEFSATVGRTALVLGDLLD